ncbi:HAD family hydrolase [Zafaria sp. Z1313]|uniref:HAD family hydrolase n=1 Tax=unclassified Zafaria TaxID=2828765 RepID=UPI002E791C18|nr:HAD-IB family hydrolase [Zafaria sp. J156]MEE1621325.1 HAD-IB family hydrolase [Zafaria sp. J156]
MPQPPAGRTVPSPVRPMTGAEAAFFDVDNTMMRGASLFAVARKMYARKAFSLRHAASFGLKALWYAVRGEHVGDIHAVRDQALALAAGVLVDDLSSLGDEVYDEFIASKIWPGTRALADQHLRAGRRVWLVTATPLEVATVIADRLGLSGALGTQVEHTDGVYTGRLVGEILHGPAKAVAVARLAEEEGLDLAQCWAYSDSSNDLPLLEAVGHPVAINPDAKLRRHAVRNNWPVYDFRTGRRAATWTLKAATVSGAVYGLWRGLGRVRGR